MEEHSTSNGEHSGEIAKEAMPRRCGDLPAISVDFMDIDQFLSETNTSQTDSSRRPEAQPDQRNRRVEAKGHEVYLQRNGHSSDRNTSQYDQASVYEKENQIKQMNRTIIDEMNKRYNHNVCLDRFLLDMGQQQQENASISNERNQNNVSGLDGEQPANEDTPEEDDDMSLTNVLPLNRGGTEPNSSPTPDSNSSDVCEACGASSSSSTSTCKSCSSNLPHSTTSTEEDSGSNKSGITSSGSSNTNNGKSIAPSGGKKKKESPKIKPKEMDLNAPKLHHVSLDDEDLGHEDSGSSSPVSEETTTTDQARNGESASDLGISGSYESKTDSGIVPDGSSGSMAADGHYQGGKPGRKRKRGYVYNPQDVIKKRPKIPIPDAQKDSKYWERRRRNNEAARRSREFRRQNEMTMHEKLLNFQRENETMRKAIELLIRRNEYLDEVLRMYTDGKPANQEVTISSSFAKSMSESNQTLTGEAKSAVASATMSSMMLEQSPMIPATRT